MKRILVTGGAGFIGSHLCDRLIDAGNYVTVVDNLQTGSILNIKHLLGHDRFEFIRCDVMSDMFVSEFTAISYKKKLDVIYNLASPASPIQYQKNPIKTFMTNVLGARNVLAIALHHRCRVVQASTSEVYGDPLVHPQPEEYFGNVNPIGERACYDEGKRAAETLFFDHIRYHKLNAGVFRIFNTYGPRMDTDDGRVVSNFVVAALQNRELTVQGTGLQTRSFAYVDDTVDGIIKFAESDLTGPVNIGNPEEFTIQELLGMIESKLGEVSVKYVDAFADDPKQRKPDITKAVAMLGWKPTIQLTDGLDNTINYFREKLQCRTHPQPQKSVTESFGI